MTEILVTADELVSAVLALSESEPVCILDSCGVGYLDSHLLIVGIRPSEINESSAEDTAETLKILDTRLNEEKGSIFTLSYNFGQKLLGSSCYEKPGDNEPDLFISTFDALIVHDYRTGRTRILGDRDVSKEISGLIDKVRKGKYADFNVPAASISSNFKKSEYLTALNEIKERIRAGDTYQTNLTQQFTAVLPPELSPQIIFQRLRHDHPAPFAAFIKRGDSFVISASPERFFRVSGPDLVDKYVRRIETSPIKGTRRRGHDPEEDAALRTDLLTSHKDIAENTMIVDLLRNDLGRVCEHGSVRVDSLCQLEEHPTFFHLVSTVSGVLRKGKAFSDILRAVFPCGSITGAPKISTMGIIDALEPTRRGLSMGAIGYHIPTGFGMPECTDLSVAIRTMVIREGKATFNVGGGIVIDSDPESEYQETLTKATALFSALGTK